MTNTTRLSMELRRWQSTISKQLKKTQKHLATDLFCLVAGFFLGNIFGTFLVAIRHFISWDILTILALTSLAEYINFRLYAKQKLSNHSELQSLPGLDPTDSRPVWRAVNLVKLGGLFGFFVDAFKVGS